MPSNCPCKIWPEIGKIHGENCCQLKNHNSEKFSIYSRNQSVSIRQIIQWRTNDKISREKRKLFTKFYERWFKLFKWISKVVLRVCPSRITNKDGGMDFDWRTHRKETTRDGSHIQVQNIEDCTYIIRKHSLFEPLWFIGTNIIHKATIIENRGVHRADRKQPMDNTPAALCSIICLHYIQRCRPWRSTQSISTTA